LIRIVQGIAGLRRLNGERLFFSTQSLLTESLMQQAAASSFQPSGWGPAAFPAQFQPSPGGWSQPAPGAPMQVNWSGHGAPSGPASSVRSWW